MNKIRNLIIFLSFFLIIFSALCIIFPLTAEKKDAELPGTAGNERKKRISHFRDKDTSAQWKSEKKRPENISPEIWERHLMYHERAKTYTVRIEFYGKIADQDGMPVPDVKIGFRVSSRLVELEKKIELFSDEEGLFSLTGVWGTSLYIEKLEKEGYIEGNRSRSFKYAKYKPIHHPDRNNPVVIRMWKKGETEPLIREETHVSVTGDNREFFADLISGKTSAELTGQADLGIRMKIEKPGPDNRGNRYNWNISIRAVDGGLIETDDEFQYQAPESGYQESMELSFDKSYRWSSYSDKKIYLKSRNGQLYAGIRLEIHAYHSGRGFIRIEGVINPNGSRNLEYDPAKRIRVKRH